MILKPYLKNSLIITMLLLSVHLGAQVANDECQDAVLIEDPVDYCSELAEFNISQATASGFGAPSCFTGVSHDVWFRFVAVNSSVVVTVDGASVAGGGTLTSPEVALYSYSGDCTGTISELECGPVGGVLGNITEISQDGLIPGEEYLIRVDGEGTRRGTFRICLRNFNPPALASSDCVTGAVLCDKSSFVVPNLEGAGSVQGELDEGCFNTGVGGLGGEFNSVWFKWICDQPGTLTFTLSPTNPIDDIDFVLFELPGGLDDCNNKNAIRCMAAGDNIVNFPSPCFGPTGLRAGSGDTNENAGCSENQDNFLDPVDMVAGRAYVLGVNNFTQSGNGIEVEFGGTGTFVGPQAAFETIPAGGVECYGEPMTFVDNSNFALGQITEWTWRFGTGASPASATGSGAP